MKKHTLTLIDENGKKIKFKFSSEVMSREEKKENQTKI